MKKSNITVNGTSSMVVAGMELKAPAVTVLVKESARVSKRVRKALIAKVSIPQAVSTVATAGSEKPVFMRFQKVVLESLKP